MSVSVTLLCVVVGSTPSDTRGVFDVPLVEVWMGWEESAGSVVVVSGGELDVVVAGTGDREDTGMLLGEGDGEGDGNSDRD